MLSSDPKIGFVSLGCPKATVDSERILTQLRAEGYTLVPRYEDAHLVIVNTCGFIDDAVAESLSTIQEALRENGQVIVTGCLGKRADWIREQFPNLLAVTGPQATQEVMQAVHEHLPPQHDPFYDLVPPQGIRLTPSHYAYLKISEGCNHKCSFCIIPSMRGKLVSRAPEDILEEAERLVQSGVKELLVISQDTSAYGIDLAYKTSFWKNRPVKAQITSLARSLGSLGVWVRLHYVYPYPHVDDLIPLMADGLILPYLDIPFQHASPKILKAMRRPANAENVLQRITQWRQICPDIRLRSTFIVGFPGETDADFEQLLQFLEDAELDRAGCFKYSPVAGARANDLPNAVPESVKQERFTQFMETQTDISAHKLDRLIGKQLQILVDHVEDDHVVGRSYGEAPDIDGEIIIETTEPVRVGQFVNVEIINSDDHDLYARVL